MPMSEEIHLLDYLRVVYRRRWVALTVFLVIVVTTAVYTLTATPVFEAKTQLMIDAEHQNVISFQEVIEHERATQDYYRTQYAILQSRSLARKVIDSLGVWEHAEFNPPPPTFSVKAMLRSAWRALTSKLRSSTPPPNLIPGADETAAESRVISAFLRRLKINPVTNSRLVDIKFDAADPLLAMRAANAVAKTYIERNLEFRFTATKEASDWLETQLAEQRKLVENAETALQKYREQNDAISLEDSQNIVVQKLADLNAAVTRAKTDRIQREATYNQLRDTQADPARIDAFPAILSNNFIQQQKSELSRLQTELAQVSERFADRHPQVIALQNSIRQAQSKLQNEIAKVVQSVRAEYMAALSQEQSLTEALNQQKDAALSMNRKAINYSVLERDVESTKQIYNSLMQRAKETNVSGELRTSNIRVVDPAEMPRSPVYPRTQFNLMLAIAIGGLMAVGICFFFEYLDNRIRRPEEIKTHLGVPFLGMVPVVPGPAGQSSPLLSSSVPANFAEAFRAVRTNVLFSSAEPGVRSMVVTSCGPGEGKTVVAANLAIGLAQAGQRVLLVDADMRRPRVHDVFGLSQEPGLSNLMVGNAKASEVVTKSASVPGLWVLCAGRIPPNPAELLGSQRFKDFVASLNSHFDAVIIDSPPVMAVTDASVVAHSASGVIFVVGSEMVSRHMAKRAMEQLENVNAHCIGAVLNKVDLHRNPYYYSNYYRRDYAAYYQKSA